MSIFKRKRRPPAGNQQPVDLFPKSTFVKQHKVWVFDQLLQAWVAYESWPHWKYLTRFPEDRGLRDMDADVKHKNAVDHPTHMQGMPWPKAKRYGGPGFPDAQRPQGE